MTGEAKGNGKKIHRSPNHPFFDLAEAIAKAKIVYEHEKRSMTTPNVIVGHLGYGQVNGPGGRTLSGLRQYGLLDESAGRYRISDIAFSILHYPESSKERREAIKKAALTPTLYRELLDQHPDGLGSDDTLKEELLRRGFNPAVTERAIADFRSTIALARLGNVSYTDPAEENKMPTPAVLSPEKQSLLATESQPGTKSYAFSFAGQGRAELRIIGEYSSEDLDDLQTHLEVTMRGLKRSKERGA